MRAQRQPQRAPLCTQRSPPRCASTTACPCSPRRGQQTRSSHDQTTSPGKSPQAPARAYARTKRTRSASSPRRCKCAPPGTSNRQCSPTASPSTRCAREPSRQGSACSTSARPCGPSRTPRARRPRTRGAASTATASHSPKRPSDRRPLPARGRRGRRWLSPRQCSGRSPTRSSASSSCRPAAEPLRAASRWMPIVRRQRGTHRDCRALRPRRLVAARRVWLRAPHPAALADPPSGRLRAQREWDAPPSRPRWLYSVCPQPAPPPSLRAHR